MATYLAPLAILLMPFVDASYVVVAPRVFRPFSNYQVAVTSSGAGSSSLLVALEGRKQNGESFSLARELTVPPLKSTIVDLEISDPGPGAYHLSVRSTKGDESSSSQPVSYQNKTFCVFIQTDKRVYQPGDTIQFKVIALDRQLRPLSGNIDASISVPDGVAVKYWVKEPLTDGLLSGDLQIADQPPLGEWTIKVIHQSQTFTQKILVADYVLPKFELKIDVKKNVIFNEKKIIANISAEYFNGQPVRGELTVAAFPVFFSEIIQPVFQTPFRQVIELNGKTSVEFDIKGDLKIAEDSARPIVLEAIVEEADTGRKQNASARLLLLRTPYSLHIEAPDHFRPGLQYTIKMEVLDLLGNPYRDGESWIRLQRRWNDGTPTEDSRVALAGGRAQFSFVPEIAQNRSTLNLEVVYMDITRQIRDVSSSYSTENNFIQAEVISDEVVVNGDFTVRLRTSRAIGNFSYVVLGRGEIVAAKTLQVPRGNAQEINMKATVNMAPAARLIIWHQQSNGQVISTSLNIPVRGILQNKVEILPNPRLARPQANVEISAVTAPGSAVGILASDYSSTVNNLAQDNGLGNGITLEMVERDVSNFISGARTIIHRDDGTRPLYGTDLGGASSLDAFKQAGVVILTDGFVESPPPSRTSAVVESLDVIESATRPPLAGPYAFSRLPEPPAPRFYLSHDSRPSWIYTNLTSGSDGRATLLRRTPSTTTNWQLGAFAVHPTLGLGIASPTNLMSVLSLNLDVDLPPSLQLGEVLGLVATIESTLNADITVDVTLHNSEQYFDFEPLPNDVDKLKSIELFKKSKITIPANGKSSTVFLVGAAKIGKAPIAIEVNGPGASISHYSELTIEAPGVELEEYSWRIVEPNKSNSIAIMVPRGATPSSSTSLAVAGDPLAIALRGMLMTLKDDELTQAVDAQYAIEPLARAAILLDYLKERASNVAQERASELIMEGMQRVLAFRVPDGSFAAHKVNKSESGDIWMTAVTARWWRLAGRLMTAASQADPVWRDALRWLLAKQTSDGSWISSTGERRPVPLTAIAMLAFYDVSGSEYRNAVNKAQDYLSRQVGDNDLDTYDLAMAAQALTTVQNPRGQAALQLLDLRANATDDKRWWSPNVPSSEARNPWLNYSSDAVETTAYALKALIALGLKNDALPVARWLLDQCNSKGTFYGSQDTIAALEALSYYSKYTNSSLNLQFDITEVLSREARHFDVDDINSLILQQKEIKNGRNVTLKAEGSGSGIVGLGIVYSTNVTLAWPRFTLDPRVDRTSTSKRLQLSICIGFVPVANETKSESASLYIRLPSGFTADLDAITALTRHTHISSARLVHGGNALHCALRDLSSSEACATLAAARTRPTARDRPGWVTIQDAYHSSRRARIFFNAKANSICDACGPFASCASACGASAQRSPEEPTDSSRPSISSEDKSPPGSGSQTALNLGLLFCNLAIAVSVAFVN